LKTLREKVETLPAFIPLASTNDPLAHYSGDPTVLTSDIPADDEVWEAWDSKLTVLISQNIPDLYPLVTRGQHGLIGLVTFMEHLVRDRKVDEGMLTGKVERLMKAIN
jgi:hypothetical protein